MVRTLNAGDILFSVFSSLHFTMSAGWDRAYSTLEAIPQQPIHQAYRQEKPLSTDFGKQVAPDEGKH